MADKKEKTEQEYVIPLRGKFRHTVRYKKTPKAVKTIREFIARHMKVYDGDMNKIKIDKNVNEYLWARGIKNPPHKVKVIAKKNSDGIVSVELVNYPDKLKFKKEREDKAEKEAIEAIEKKKTMMQKAKESLQKPKESGEKTDNKTESKEKEETSKEAEEKIEKDLAKKEKHIATPKSRKETRAEKKVYNKQSRGE